MGWSFPFLSPSSLGMGAECEGFFITEERERRWSFPFTGGLDDEDVCVSSPC